MSYKTLHSLYETIRSCFFIENYFTSKFFCYILFVTIVSTYSVEAKKKRIIEHPYNSNGSLESNNLNQSSSEDYTNLFSRSNETFIKVNSQNFNAILFSPRTRIIIPHFGLPNDADVTLILDKFEMANPNTKYILNNADGESTFQKEAGIFLQGTIAGRNSSHVFLAIFRNYCFGVVETNYLDPENNQCYQILPYNYRGSGEAKMLILEISSTDLSTSSGTNLCNSTFTSNQVTEMFKSNKKGDQNLSTRTPLELDICIDTDYKFYQNSQNNFQYASSYALAIMAGVSAVLQRDMNVKLRTNFVRVWTIAPPNANYPYPVRTAYANDADYNGGLHVTAINIWSLRAEQRAMVNILSGDNLSGVSWLNTTCGSSAVYESGSSYSDFYGSIKCSLHEIGHAFGSQHSHDQNPDFGYTPPIDSCHLGGRFARAGSVMSYCYPSLSYFHPREQTKIRDYLETHTISNGGCVRDNLNSSQDIELTAIQVPQAGSTIHNGRSGTPPLCAVNGIAGFMPMVTLRNRGFTPLQGQTTLQVQIFNNSNVLVYTNTIPIPLLAPLTTFTTNTFTPPACSSFTTANGPYRIVATAINAADPFLINNSMTNFFNVVDVPSNDNITLNHPNTPNLVFTAGQTIGIDFTTSSPQSIRVEFSADDGATWVPIDSHRVATVSPILWTIPPITTSQGRIRVYHLNSTSSADISDFPFAIVVGQDIGVDRIDNPFYLGIDDNPSIASAPFIPQVKIGNVGLVNQTNIPVKMKIVRADSRGEVEIYSEIKIIAFLEANRAHYLDFPEVFVGNFVGPTVQYMIYVETQSTLDDNPNNNKESRTFRISQNNASIVVLSPNGQENLQPGTDYVIRWTAPPQAAPNCPPSMFPVRISYSIDGTTWLQIADNIMTIGGLGAFTWHIPNTITKNTVRIRVEASPQLSFPCGIAIGFSEQFTILPLQTPFDVKVRSVANAGIGNVMVSWQTPFVPQSISFFEVLRATENGSLQQIAVVPVQTAQLFYEYRDENISHCVKYMYAVKAHWVDVTTIPSTEYESSVTPLPITPLPVWETNKTMTGTRSWLTAPRFDVYGDAAAAPIRGSRVQFLIRADELIANGFTGSSNFTDIGFNNFWAKHGKTLKNFQIRLKNTATSSMTTTFDNVGLITVLAQSDFKPFDIPDFVSKTDKWNMHSIAPFDWDGISNILVDVSFFQDNDNGTSGIVPVGSEVRTAKVIGSFRSTTFVTSSTDDVSNAAQGTLVTANWREDFRIAADRPNLAITAPNAPNTSWIKGKTYYIVWNPGCSDLNKVTLRYFDYSNQVNNEVITPNGIDNIGAYEWTVPANKNSTNQAKIRVEGYGNPAFFDESDVPFTIRDQNSAFTITSPSANVSWMLGARKTIEWTTTGTDPVIYVKIEYSIDGVTWFTVAPAIQNTGTYVWDINGVPLSGTNANARIRISDALNTSLSSTSGLFFVLSLPSPELLSATPSQNPNRISLVWAHPIGIAPADHNGYFVCRGADANSVLPIAAVSANATTYEDESIEECVRYFYTIQTRTTGGLTSNHSNNENALIQTSLPFNITSPNGGERWIAGTVHDIAWKICNVNFSSIKIEYSLNNGQSWLAIASSAPNNGSFRWSVPQFPSASALVRITNATVPFTPTDISDATFEIVVLPKPNLSTGTYHNLVLKPSSGTVAAWGYNSTGQIGDGTYGSGNFKITPIIIGGLNNVKKVSAGGVHSLALKTDGTVWAWGAGSMGQLGNNSTTVYATPQKIELCLNGNVTEQFVNVKDISAGGQFNLALKFDGTVYAWGRNTNGEIGDGGSANSMIPKKVIGLENVTAISAGESIALVLKNDGTLWAWGTLKSYSGDILGIGDGVQAIRRTPQFVLSGIANVSSHGEHVLAVKSNGGLVYSWGDNWFYQLGRSLPPYFTTSPQIISNFSNVSTVICGTYSSFAIKGNGTLWAWGAGNDGILGNGLYGAISTPTQITNNVNNLSTISCGTANSIIYKTDGTLCTSGINMYGALGDPSVTINDKRNLFGCLSGNYSKYFDSNVEDYIIERVNPLPDNETDSLQLRYRLMQLSRKMIEHEGEDVLATHPNPSNSSISIQLKKDILYNTSSLTLCNLLGEVVYTTTLSNNESTHLINTSGLPNGVYIIKVTNSSQIISQSIIISH